MERNLCASIDSEHMRGRTMRSCQLEQVGASKEGADLAFRALRVIGTEARDLMIIDHNSLVQTHPLIVQFFVRDIRDAVAESIHVDYMPFDERRGEFSRQRHIESYVILDLFAHLGRFYPL